MDLFMDLEKLGDNAIGLSRADFGLIKVFLSVASEESILGTILDKMCPHKDQITRRDVAFFQTQKHVLFNGLPKEKIDRVGEKIKNLSEQNLNSLWAHFDVIVYFAETQRSRR